MKKILSLLLLFICAASVTLAQELREFSVTGFVEKPFDTSARDERYKIIDGNGEYFSIIKLVAQTPGDDMRAYAFDFGLCESRIKEVDGEVWVYVQRNAMRSTIKRDGFKTVKHELNTTVQPGKVYEMTLSAAPKVIVRQFLVFEISPADSEAIITYKMANTLQEYKPFGNGKVDAAGRLAKSLELGTYAYKIISSNYYSTEGLVELNVPNGRYVEQLVLKSNFANVSLSTSPGADIYINEEKVASASWNGKLSPGTYSVECRKASHRSSTETITVVAGSDITLQLKEPTPITGTLSLNSDPLGAKITIDGKEYGETPDFITGLVIGEHRVELACSGYESKHFTVTVKENECVELNMTLDKIVERVTTTTDCSSSDTAETASVDKEAVSTAKDTASATEVTAPTTNNGHEYVDLGLSVKWATCNVGATKPEQYGDYFSWGETNEKWNYAPNTYKYGGYSSTWMSKYSPVGKNADNKRELDPEDDVAHVRWGGTWRMPTLKEQQELLYNCTWTWTTVNGIKGCLVTSNINGNSIFLPAAGHRNGKDVSYGGRYGNYWSTSLGGAEGRRSFSMEVRSDRPTFSSIDRYLGCVIRPVCK